MGLLTIKSGFPGPVLPQRVRINLLLLWNDVFSRFSKPSKNHVFQECVFWPSNLDFPGRFCPRGFVLISVCSETTFFQGFQDLSKMRFSRLGLLNIKYGFPGSVLPQRVHINLRLLWNDVIQGFQTPFKTYVVQEWVFWTSNLDFPVWFCPRGFVLISDCSETTFFQGFQKPCKSLAFLNYFSRMKSFTFLSSFFLRVTLVVREVNW